MATDRRYWLGARRVGSAVDIGPGGWVALVMVTLLAAVLARPTGCAGDEWPQWRGPNRDGVWRETGIVESLPGPTIPLRWRVPISSGYTGPTVAGGRVFVMDRQTQPREVERVHCFAWQTGEKLWSHSYECPYEVSYAAGPRASVTIDQGQAYALGTMGHLHCYDAATGRVLWSVDLRRQYQIRMPIWGIAAAPLVEADLVILQIGGAGGACVVALDKRTGQERWRALDDPASYSAPIVIEQARRRVLVCWTGDHVAGLDPATGEVFWKHPFERRHEVINVPTPVVDGDRLFVTAFWDGALLLRLRQDALGVERVWRRFGPSERNTDALHAMISTPILQGDHIYGVDSYGELRCLDARSGDRIWEDLTAVPKARWATIHMVRHGHRVWMFNERGELILGELSPRGFREISRAKLLDPTTPQLQQRGGVCWSHPAFAYKHIFARNDRELVCASLAAEPSQQDGNSPSPQNR